jgi:5'-nucleotidase
MRILVSSDDGIYSPGILALAEAAADFGDVRVVAPHVEQSSMGHAITSTRPLSYHRTAIKDFEAFRVNGTPADCIALGAYQWDKVDLVLSGINLGTNLGNSIWHSGTLAAAKQAALLGIRGIALSTSIDDGEPDFSKLRPYVDKVLKMLIERPKSMLLNVNLPREPTDIQWTRQSVRQYDGKVVPGTDPKGNELFWFTVTPLKESEEGTDRCAFEKGWVSITPLRLDLTDEEDLGRVQEERSGA